MFMGEKKCILKCLLAFLRVSRPIHKELFSADDLCKMALSPCEVFLEPL